MKKLFSCLLAILCLLTVTLAAACTAEKPTFSVNDRGELICCWPDGSIQNLGSVRGEDGKDGADGQDGKDGADGQDGKDGADGQDGKDGADGQDGKDGSQITIGENGHWYIDGEDTFVMAGERDVIKVTPRGEDIQPYVFLPLQFRTVPQTDHALNMDNFQVDYAADGSIQSRRLVTTDVRDVYAFYDSLCRDFDPRYNGLLVLPDTRGLTSVTTTYQITQRFMETETAPTCIHYYYTIRGCLQVDGSYHLFSVVINTYVITLEQYYVGFTEPENADLFTRYICADGDKIIEEPCNISLGELYRYKNHSASCYTAIDYPKSQENPLQPLMPLIQDAFYYTYQSRYYFMAPCFTIYESDDLTDDQIYDATYSIIQALQDCFVVYDYEHYRHQFDT